jgi:hypothetical protein
MKQTISNKVRIKSKTYNSFLVYECRKLKGKWNLFEDEWVFENLTKSNLKKVENLKELYESEEIKVEVTVNKKAIYSTNFMGYTVIDLADYSPSNIVKLIFEDENKMILEINIPSKWFNEKAESTQGMNHFKFRIIE